MGLVAKNGPKTGNKTKRAEDKVRKKTGKLEEEVYFQQQKRHKNRMQARRSAQAHAGLGAQAGAVRCSGV